MAGVLSRSNPATLWWCGKRKAVLLVGIFCLGITAAAAEQIKKSFSTSATPSLLLHNHVGDISVKGWERNEIAIQGERFSEAVDVTIVGGKQKVTVETHPQREGLSPQEARVDLQIRVPRRATVRLDCEGGDIEVENIQGDVSIEGMNNSVDLSQIRGHISVRTVDGSISIRSSEGYISAQSISGNLKFVGVSGSELVGNTNSGEISYEGDFGSGGNYVLNNYSSGISIVASDKASFDLTARAVQGSIDSKISFRPTPFATPFRVPSPGKFLQGRFNSGESTVRVTSYSGTIRLRRLR